MSKNITTKVIQFVLMVFFVSCFSSKRIVKDTTVMVDGSIEYQTIEGLGGLMEDHGLSNHLWDILFNNVGVSAIYLCPLTRHVMLDPKETFPVLREAKNYGVNSSYVGFLSHPISWKNFNDFFLKLCVFLSYPLNF